MAQAALPAHIKHGHEPHVIVVREHGTARAILPLVATSMAGSRVLRFLGDPLIQYGDALLSRSGSEAHLVQALLAAGKLGADAALFRKVRSDAKLAAILSRRGHVSSVEEAPYVDLRREATLPPRDARELRRYRRRLAEQGEVKLHITRGGEAHHCVRAALDLKRGWLSAKGFSSSVIGDPHWEAVLTSLVADHAHLLACARLEIGGKVAAIEVAITHGKRWHAFLGAIAPEFAKSGPGQVQMADTIEHARERGFLAYDLLAPADPFKRVIATGAVAVCDYALPLSLQGQVAARAMRFAPHAKSLLGKLPAPIRSARRAFCACGKAPDYREPTSSKIIVHGCRFRPGPFVVWVEAGTIRGIGGNQRRIPMRFMVIVKATKDSEAGVMPSEELLVAMGKFNEELVKAGVMLDGMGLQPSAKGARIKFDGDKRTVVDGPFAETKELVAGFWLIQVKSLEEAIEWMKRCPNPHNDGGELEIRQVYELEDFAPGEGIRIHEKVQDELKKQK